MIWIVFIIGTTLLLSAFCSTLEAMVLSTTPIEIEALKKKSATRGALMEKLVGDFDSTISAILALNTVANTFGATLAGVQCADVFGTDFSTRYIIPTCLTVAILLFSEILPKKISVFYRKSLQGILTYPLWIITLVMAPVAKACGSIIGIFTPKVNPPSTSDDEIILLAEKGAKDGLLTDQEKDLISNALSLDDVEISEIMTPRTVLVAFEASMTAESAFKKGLSFSRIPVYEESIDNIVGIVRRRDILTAMANDRNNVKISEFAQPAIFVPENGSALNVLRQLIKKHQQMGIVVDEFSSLTGVVTLEDIFEKLLGSEIFDKDDVAVDMREFALLRRKRSMKNNPVESGDK